MKTSLLAAAAVAILAALSFFYSERSSPPRPATPATHGDATRLLGGLPVAFVPNVGQWAHAARFVMRAATMTVFLEEKGWTCTLVEGAPKATDSGGGNARGVAVRMTLVGADTRELVAEDELPGRHNYFLGNDSSRWRSDVPLYRSVRYRGIHPGVDVRAREEDGHFEYDLLLRPGAELATVELAVEGIERMHLDDAGGMVLETAVGPVRMSVPRTWEEGPSGERCPVACRYVLHGANRFGFEVAQRRPGWTLTVDPGLVWSKRLGGVGDDQGVELAIDAEGAATVTGYTVSSDFPTTPGAFATTYNGGTSDAFVTRISPTGSSLVYSTFLGGRGVDYASGIAVDAEGAATVAGYTMSSDFPTTAGAFDTSHNGGLHDVFIARLTPAGSGLVYSTFLGGQGFDVSGALALDAEGEAVVAGYTYSSDFPTTPGAYDTSYDGGDAFVTRLSATGSSLVHSTFLGGPLVEYALAVALDDEGGATVAGYTESSDFPTTPGAFDTSYNGGGDAFVTRFSPTGASLVYSTFLGGADSRYDWASAVVLDAEGAATVVGYTESASFPTTPGAWDTSYNGGGDAFVTALSPTGSSLVWSTYLGGTKPDTASTVALDARGAGTVGGGTSSADFPTTAGAYDTQFDGGGFPRVEDAFVTQFAPTGSALVYSTFLGDFGVEEISGLALDPQGAATVVGTDDTDAFVSHLDLLPAGVSAFGSSSPGCTGPLAMSVTSMPGVGSVAFALAVGNAPPSAGGLFVLAAGRLQTPVIALGVELWIDPSLVFESLPAVSNAIGAADAPLPLPAEPSVVGAQFFAQFYAVGPTSPPPCPPLRVSASNALEITIQP